MNLAQKAKGLSTQWMMHEELSKELIKRDIQIDIPELQKLEAKRDALEIIINADEVLIKSYLDKLKVIISSDNEHELPEAMKNLLEEQKENA